MKKTKKTKKTRRKTISGAAKDCRFGGARGEYGKGYRLFKTRIYTDLISSALISVNPCQQRLTAGAVVVLQSFSKSLDFNPHIHILCISGSVIAPRSLQSLMKDLIALDGVNPSVLHNCTNSAFSSVLTFAEIAIMSLVGILYLSLKFGLSR